MFDISYLLLIYLVLINLIGLVIMYIDKSKARRHRWRVPEATLFFIAAVGGSLGSWAGMYLFRHKTKHLSFVIGIPLILIVQIIAAVRVLLF